MPNDYTTEMFMKTLNELLENKINKGISEDEIDKFLQSEAISNMYQKIVKVMAMMWQKQLKQ